jgi:hypothetical protein
MVASTFFSKDFDLLISFWNDFLIDDYGDPRDVTSINRMKPFYLKSNDPLVDPFNAIYDPGLNPAEGNFQHTLYIRHSDQTKSLDHYTIQIGATASDFFRYQFLESLQAPRQLWSCTYAFSKAYDAYVRAQLVDFIANDLNSVRNPLSGPVKIPGNVKGGTGIFAAYSVTILPLRGNKCRP